MDAYAANAIEGADQVIHGKVVKVVGVDTALVVVFESYKHRYAARTMLVRSEGYWTSPDGSTTVSSCAVRFARGQTAVFLIHNGHVGTCDMKWNPSPSVLDAFRRSSARH